ncbi:hypothetical protein HYH03_009354 [Edaphochlamys debaryana]|uniref:BACK domain-containing protein n=1 Tax=Edaphochlamys debaryana TaxID=47281 RepID=A0A835Y1L6_9CHLO|nr:hypothetical protein HYH03_009354 [Edaphochlamys debaryana]|eukprot:KAG2492411.1 hypothetical protein HYH03_009354 [Edaphochlamys debaryana]
MAAAGGPAEPDPPTPDELAALKAVVQEVESSVRCPHPGEPNPEGIAAVERLALQALQGVDLTPPPAASPAPAPSPAPPAPQAPPAPSGEPSSSQPGGPAPAEAGAAQPLGIRPPSEAPGGSGGGNDGGGGEEGISVDLLIRAGPDRVRALVAAFAALLRRTLTASNCFSALLLGRRVGCGELEEAATLTCLANFNRAVAKDRAAFLALDESPVLQLTSNSNLQISHELDVWQAVAEWVQADLEPRRPLLYDLIRGGVRLGEMDTLQLGQVSQHPLLSEPGPAAMLVSAAYSARIFSNVHLSSQRGRAAAAVAAGASAAAAAAAAGALAGAGGGAPPAGRTSTSGRASNPGSQAAPRLQSAHDQAQASLKQLIAGLQARAMVSKLKHNLKQETEAQKQQPGESKPGGEQRPAGEQAPPLAGAAAGLLPAANPHAAGPGHRSRSASPGLPLPSGPSPPPEGVSLERLQNAAMAAAAAAAAASQRQQQQPLLQPVPQRPPPRPQQQPSSQPGSRGATPPPDGRRSPNPLQHVLSLGPLGTAPAPSFPPPAPSLEPVTGPVTTGGVDASGKPLVNVLAAAIAKAAAQQGVGVGPSGSEGGTMSAADAAARLSAAKHQLQNNPQLQEMLREAKMRMRMASQQVGMAGRPPLPLAPGLPPLPIRPPALSPPPEPGAGMLMSAAPARPASAGPSPGGPSPGGPSPGAGPTSPPLGSALGALLQSGALSASTGGDGRPAVLTIAPEQLLAIARVVQQTLRSGQQQQPQMQAQVAALQAFINKQLADAAPGSQQHALLMQLQQMLLGQGDAAEGGGATAGGVDEPVAKRQRQE